MALRTNGPYYRHRLTQDGLPSKRTALGPKANCYRALLERADNIRMNRDFIFDVGDWAAAYSDNCYVPMCTKFWADYEAKKVANCFVRSRIVFIFAEK